MSPRQEFDATKRQDAAFRAYLRTGSVKGAAYELGLTERAVRKHLSGYCDAHGYRDLVDAVFRFGTSQRGAEQQP